MYGLANQPLHVRFWLFVDQNGPMPKHCPNLGRCWVWTGSGDRYGNIQVEGHTTKAHRVAWFLKTGKWPKHNALHKCDNGRCVRFSHLFDGTQKKNAEDRQRKGRGNQVNGERNGKSLLTEKDIRYIRTEVRTGTTQRAVAKVLGVHYSTVNKVIRGKNWKHTKEK